MNTPFTVLSVSMAKKAKTPKEDYDPVVGVRVDETMLSEIEAVGQQLRLRSQSERIRYLIGRGIEAHRTQFPQPQPHASATK